MKQTYSTFSLVTVISLLLGVIWLSPAFAAVPSFISLGQIKADSLRVPGAMDLDGSGTLYVADNRGGLVHKFAPHGQLLEDFALQASGSGLAVTTDGLRLYVSRKQSVVIVDASTGEELGTLTGSGDPEFHVAGEIDLDAAGNVYVVDAGSMMVKIYDASGQYQNQFGGIGLNAGQFKKIGGMAINPAGQVVITESSALNAKVHVFSDVFSIDTGLNVAAVTTFANTSFGTPVMSSPRGLTFDANGRGFFLEYIHSEVRVSDANFVYLGAYTNAVSPDPEVGQLNNVIDTVFDDINNRLFVGCDSGRIEIFGLDGTGTNPVNINHAPSKPVHLSPVDGSEVASSTPTLVFNNSTDEDGDSLTYHVIVSRSGVSVFETDVEAQASSTTSMVVGVALEENATYSWTVQAADGDDVSEVSDAATFLVNAVPDNHAPSMPVLQSPIAGSEVTSVTPTLVFNNATDEDGDSLTYHVIVSLAGESVFATSVDAQASSTTSVLVGVALEENTAYSWTVQAADDVDVSEITVAATFVVNAVEEAPDPPELLAPADNASIAGVDLLSWTEPDDSDPNDYISGYQVEIAADEAFVEVLMAQSVDANDLELRALQDYSLFEDGAVYFWRVTALDSDQLSSPAGIARQFVYDTTALSVTANMPDAVVSFSGNHAYAGEVVGVAPLELRDFEPGTLSVVVTRDGFEPFVANVTLAETANVALYAKLVPTMEVRNLASGNKGINGRDGLSVSGAAAPFLVDFDNDGDLDLLVGDGSGQISLFSNMQITDRNQLYFDQGILLDLPVMPGAVPFVADWDNNGRKDLLIGQSDGSVKLFTNSGTEIAPSFGPGEDLLVGDGALSVGTSSSPVVVDYNSDGAKDLLVGNEAGQVVVYLNQGTDAVPQLTNDPVLVHQANGAVVPFLVDWDADGQQELILTADGNVTVYAQVEGQFQALVQFSEAKTDFVAAFPIDLQGMGKQLLVGQADGQVVYLSGNSLKPVASFGDALQDKVAELSALVDLEAPELMSDIAPISANISAADYAQAALLVNDLALALPAGLAQVSAFELFDLLAAF